MIAAPDPHRLGLRPPLGGGAQARHIRGAVLILRQSLVACPILQENSGQVLWRRADQMVRMARAGTFHRDDISRDREEKPLRAKGRGTNLQSGEARWLVVKAFSVAASLRAR
jgi:hypothetical protein